MTDTTGRNRVPQGVTTGGQFATEPKAETSVTLAEAAPTAQDRAVVALHGLSDDTPRTYETRNEVVEREIIAAIESSGTDIARASEYDIDAIADEVVVTDDDGRFYVRADQEEFWSTVERYARD